MSSLIKEVHIENFMTIENATLEFDETNVLNLKGYNGSGKTAILLAVACLLFNRSAKEQGEFITHGRKYFLVSLLFDDGVKIIRVKYATGPSLYEMYKNDKLIFTTKMGNKYTKITGVPEPIAKYLNMTESADGYFNFQSRKEPMPLAEWNGSENYESLHTALRLEEIFSAQAMINTDKNKLSTEIASLENELNVYEGILTKYQDVSEYLIKELESKDKVLDYKQSKLSDIESILSDIEKLENTKSLPELSKIDISRFKDLVKTYEVLNKLETYSAKVLPEISKVDITRLKDSESLLSSVNKLDSVVDKGILPEIKKVNVDSKARLDSVNKLSKVFNDLVKYSKELKNIDTGYEAVIKKLSDNVEKAKEEGYVFKKCSNCGTYNVVSIKD